MNTLATKPTRSRRPYQSQRQQLRAADILAVARAALSDKGYEGITMNGLAAEAGVTKRTLYNLYGSKDQLLQTAIGEVIARYRDPQRKSNPGFPTIVESRRISVDEIVATPAYADAMTRTMINTPNDHPLNKALLADSITFITEHLEHANQCNELNGTVPVTLLAQQIVSQGWGTALLRMKGLIDNEQFATSSMAGLILLLISASRGKSQSALHQHFNQLTAKHDQGDLT